MQLHDLQPKQESRAAVSAPIVHGRERTIPKLKKELAGLRLPMRMNG